jgi:hypothetical protein
MTYRTFWVTWQQWTPFLIVFWFVGFSALIFGIRRGFKEMMLHTTLKSDQPKED